MVTDVFVAILKWGKTTYTKWVHREFVGSVLRELSSFSLYINDLTTNKYKICEE